VTEIARRPKLAVWKFTSCDGCQLSILNLEDELLLLPDAIEISRFLEATRAEADGPYDLSIVEGSISTAEEEERIREIRRISKALVTIGACANAGGIQALRNFADMEGFVSAVYANPEYISTLDTSTPVSAHVAVDFELQGCPPSSQQVLEVITAFLADRSPGISSQSVCVECKIRGNVCVMVADGTPCLGPVTHAGCGAICPAYDRGCYGCFGPKETPNARSLSHWLLGMGVDQADLVPTYRNVNAFAEPFASASRDAEAAELPGPHPERRPHDNQATNPERWSTKPGG
jgi:coenzyme F420-reducing hydrogenase gamma subunit